MADLTRSLTRVNATAMVAGTIIGASIFVQPSEIARHLDTPGTIMLAWAACGVLTLFGALICAELVSAFPQPGGVYVFLREAFSPLAGFLWGWAMFWSVHSGIIAAIAVVFARYAVVLLPGAAQGDAGVRLIAVAVILALSAINYVGVRAGSRVQTALTIVKVVAIMALVVAGFAAGGRPAEPPVVTAGAGLTPFVLAMVAGLFAFGGWHMVTYTAGETTMPAKTIPVALVLGVAIVTVCYVALNLVYLRLLPLDAVRASTRIAADAADVMFGRGGAQLLSVLVLLSAVGSLTGIILTGPRMYYSMAQDGLAPRALSYVHPRFQTPSHAIIAQALWASALAGTGAYRQLFTRVVYTEWLFFALMAVGLFVLRRRPDYQPPYRTWGYPAVPIVFIGISLFIVLHQFIADPAEAAFGMGFVAIGAPVYYYLRHANHRLP
ncbi:MAG TPA: amino acid permease [Vicinamibacterales bacterium]|nr:amino acid permease [Vicinamibacterales bacterium]